MSNVKDTLEAVQGIVEAVPVYEDMLQPATQELSKGVLTIAKTINMALFPLAGLVWSYEKIKDKLLKSLEKKLKDVPEENIITPDASIAVPTIEALRYTGQNEELREMFSTLLATAMNSSSARFAHPAFVEIIKQINHDEAKIIKYLTSGNATAIVRVRMFDPDSTEERFAEPIANFSTLPFVANCTFPELGPSYLENLERLGLANISYDVYSILPDAYVHIENHPIIQHWKDAAPSYNKRFEIQRGAFTLTSFGKKFIKSCVYDQ